MADPILPSANVFVTAAIDAVVQARPSTLAHFNNPSSVYGALPAMWRAQALLLLARDADEVKSARLRFAKGDALRTLAASEFRTQIPAIPQTAIAQVTMVRTGTAAGTIPAGTSFTKVANTSAVPLPIAAATYTTIAPVYFAENQQTAHFNLIATAAGVGGNLPSFLGYSTAGLIVPSSTLFDSTLTTTFSNAAGGSSGLPDPVLVAACKAYAVGQFGPTQGAVLAGLLEQQSVRHCALFPASQAIPYGGAFIADETWADSIPWHQQVAQNISNQWTGLGCRIRFGAISNVQVAVSASFVLKSTNDLNDTTAIDLSVRSAAELYFNERLDWYRFRMSTLQQLLTSCDARIKRCSALTVTNALDGSTTPETSGSFYNAFPFAMSHNYLSDANVTTSYAPPS
jgi:hypothetical protein